MACMVSMIQIYAFSKPHDEHWTFRPNEHTHFHDNVDQSRNHFFTQCIVVSFTSSASSSSWSFHLIPGKNTNIIMPEYPLINIIIIINITISFHLNFCIVMRLDYVWAGSIFCWYMIAGKIKWNGKWNAFTILLRSL